MTSRLIDQFKEFLALRMQLEALPQDLHLTIMCPGNGRELDVLQYIIKICRVPTLQVYLLQLHSPPVRPATAQPLEMSHLYTGLSCFPRLRSLFRHGLPCTS